MMLIVAQGLIEDQSWVLGGTWSWIALVLIDD